MPESDNQNTPLQDQIDDVVNTGQSPGERLAGQLTYTLSTNPPACGDLDNCGEYKKLRSGKCPVEGCNASKPLRI